MELLTLYMYSLQHKCVVCISCSELYDLVWKHMYRYFLHTSKQAVLVQQCGGSAAVMSPGKEIIGHVMQFGSMCGLPYGSLMY